MCRKLTSRKDSSNLCVPFYGNGIWVVNKTHRKVLKTSDEDEVLLKTDAREELAVDLVGNTYIRRGTLVDGFRSNETMESGGT